MDVRFRGAVLSALYDSHCHLDFNAFDADRDAVIARAAAAGVETILVPGVDAAQWARAAAMESAVRLRFAVGVHPQAGEVDLEALAAWIDRLGACAVGELGWDKRRGDLERQSQRADAQLEVARARGLPVIVHVVGAHGLALERLARYAPLAGVVHGYSGSPELVSRYVALGLSVAFGPSVTRAGARKVLEAARRAPLEHLLVETDAPDQRVSGDRGEPAELVRVVEAVASARAEPAEIIARATAANARRLFG